MNDLDDLHAYWQRNPPVGVLMIAIAKSLGIKFPEPVAPEKHLTRDEAMRLFQHTKGRVTADMVFE